MLGLAKPIEFQAQLFYIPKVFVFGAPRVEWNMVVTAFCNTHFNYKHARFYSCC